MTPKVNHAGLLAKVADILDRQANAAKQSNRHGSSEWEPAPSLIRELRDAAQSLRTQAPDSWRPDRSEIIDAIEDADQRLAYGMELVKLVDDDHTYRLKIDGQTLFFTDSETEEWNAQERLYAYIREAKNRIRAEAVIAALRPQTAESGK